MNLLYQRWLSLTKRLQIPDNQADVLFQEIEKHYNNTNRQYHNLDHLTVLLHFFEKFKAVLKDPDLVEAAIWYHDIIYDVKQQDNEAQSALLAKKRLAFSKLSPSQIEAVSIMIQATKAHKYLADIHPMGTPFLLDFDLAILGSDWSSYQEYAQKIRQEYHIYPGDLFNTGRAHALAIFLERERIYHTSIFHAEREELARSNLQREIDELSNKN